MSEPCFLFARAFRFCAGVRGVRPFFALAPCIFAASPRSGSYFEGAQSPENTGAAPGNSTRRLLVCELLVCRVAVRWADGSTDDRTYTFYEFTQFRLRHLIL